MIYFLPRFPLWVPDPYIFDVSLLSPKPLKSAYFKLNSWSPCHVSTNLLLRSVFYEWHHHSSRFIHQKHISSIQFITKYCWFPKSRFTTCLHFYSHYPRLNFPLPLTWTTTHMGLPALAEPLSTSSPYYSQKHLSKYIMYPPTWSLSRLLRIKFKTLNMTSKDLHRLDLQLHLIPCSPPLHSRPSWQFNSWLTMFLVTKRSLPMLFLLNERLYSQPSVSVWSLPWSQLTADQKY